MGNPPHRRTTHNQRRRKKCPCCHHPDQGLCAAPGRHIQLQRRRLHQHRNHKGQQEAQHDVSTTVPHQAMHNIPPGAGVKCRQVDPDVKGALPPRPGPQPQQQRKAAHHQQRQQIAEPGGAAQPGDLLRIAVRRQGGQHQPHRRAREIKQMADQRPGGLNQLRHWPGGFHPGQNHRDQEDNHKQGCKTDAVIGRRVAELHQPGRR